MSASEKPGRDTRNSASMRKVCDDPAADRSFVQFTGRLVPSIMAVEMQHRLG